MTKIDNLARINNNHTQYGTEIKMTFNGHIQIKF